MFYDWFWVGCCDVEYWDVGVGICFGMLVFIYYYCYFLWFYFWCGGGRIFGIVVDFLVWLVFVDGVWWYFVVVVCFFVYLVVVGIGLFFGD